MASFKTSKKHHKHVNNPFPSTPKTLPPIQGNLLFNPQTISPNQAHHIGHDFQLIWSSANGGSLSIFHNSNLSRSIWSTVPGRAFVSAASADTEVEESRGSFVIKDKQVHLICNHQTVEDIRLVQQTDLDSCENDHDMGDKFPVVVIMGRIYSSHETKRLRSVHAKYWMLFDQKNSNQVGFRVRVEKPSFAQPVRASSRGFAWKVRRMRRVRVGFWGFFSRRKVVITVSPAQEDNVVLRNGSSPDFNRICITYSSERSERFYGFGEQFSHMDFKGRRVPIFVQEQGIGRGDQPITFAANLVSYRAGGDDSTTYAPSPFYMTSKMRSLYLEGYNYSVFDLTKHDRVHIQVHGDQIEGRILHGNSPTEIIQNFTETIGRPRELPEWIISGAVVGMQGGTDAVRSIWEQLFLSYLLQNLDPEYLKRSSDFAHQQIETAFTQE